MSCWLPLSLKWKHTENFSYTKIKFKSNADEDGGGSEFLERELGRAPPQDPDDRDCRGPAVPQVHEDYDTARELGRHYGGDAKLGEKTNNWP